MAAKSRTPRAFASLLAAGAALVALSACDQIKSRLDQFGKLTDDVSKQVNGQDVDPAQDPLLAAPLEARAVFGVQTAPIELQPVSLDDLLQTQSFYAVGSLVAKPKEEIAEPVLETESFDLAAADPSAPATADSTAAAALNSNAAAPTDSSQKAAGAPVVEAQPEVAPPATTTVPAPNAPNRTLSVRVLPGLRKVEAPEMRQQAIVAPKALEQAAKESSKDTGVKLDREKLRMARGNAEQAMKATTSNAQAIGDSVSRNAATEGVPKMLMARNRLKVDVALAQREKVEQRILKRGLSGVVTAGEGGQMRITLGVKPTQLGAKFDPSQVTAMRSLFAKVKDTKQEECAGAVTTQAVQADLALATECLIKDLKATGDYEYVEKDFIFTNQFMKKPKPATPTVFGVTPNDPLFGLQWHFKGNGVGAGQSAGGAGFQDFWTKQKLEGSRSVNVAIVDTGLQMNHPDIKGSANLAPGFDMVDDPSMGNDGDGRDTDPNDPGDRCDVNDPTTSDSFHGTHVAGTIGVGSTNNASGVAGGAWDVTIVPVRALGRCGGKLSDINDGIRWAAGVIPGRDSKGAEVWNSHPADIINLSIGLFEPCPASMQSAINDAVARGAIVVVAAGNARVDAKYFAPGGCDNVISVAANDARGVLTPYSNFGDKISIMAPGGDMSRDDDGDGRPDGVLSTKYSKNCYDPAKPKEQVAACYYAYENGTSMAAPHVAAALALLKAKFPSLEASKLKDKLLASSMARTQSQCSGKCTAYPGTTPIPGDTNGMCFRPCGAKMLNLANVPAN
ncbi:MAG TPA: S8 family peptidase [Hyphomonadaceae bacterium]|nr:S8 family peptidase [Hyphomonadaceae bacterium]